MRIGNADLSAGWGQSLNAGPEPAGAEGGAGPSTRGARAGRAAKTNQKREHGALDSKPMLSAVLGTKKPGAGIQALGCF